MKITRNENADSFSPQVWTTERDGARVSILVCGKRFARSENLPKAEQFPGGPILTDFQTVEDLIHPCAISLSFPVAILYTPQFPDSKWLVETPEAHGIPTRNAQAALCEAYRGIESASEEWPRRRLHIKSHVPLVSPSVGSAKPSERTMLRNVALLVHLGFWRKQGIAPKDFPRTMADIGFPNETTKSTGRILEEYGL